MRALDRFQRMALLTTATTYLLIAVGALVRASGAGLGCPDWPKCFGLWIPPIVASDLPPEFTAAQFNALKTWMEYINRLLGALTGLLILITSILAIRDHRKVVRVWAPTVAALALVVVNAWLGGQVVRSGLKPWVLTGHMVMALVVVSLLLYATVSAFFPRGPLLEVEPSRVQLGWVTAGTIAMVLVQIGLGAFLRGEVQAVAQEGVPRGEWLLQVGLIESIHESFAVLAAAAVGLSSALAFRESDRGLKQVAVLSLTLVGLQVGAGIGLGFLGFPRVLQVIHLWAAALLLGALTLQGMLAFRLDPRTLTSETMPS